MCTSFALWWTKKNEEKSFSSRHAAYVRNFYPPSSLHAISLLPWIRWKFFSLKMMNNETKCRCREWSHSGSEKFSYNEGVLDCLGRKWQWRHFGEDDTSCESFRQRLWSPFKFVFRGICVGFPSEEISNS